MDVPQIDEHIDYPEEQRDANVATLLEIMGGAPAPEVLELVLRRDEEFAASRSHAA